MKIIGTLLYLICGISVFAQNNEIQIQGKITNINGAPIGDVYIINARTHEKDITKSDGVYTISASTDDTLILSHISYNRKAVKVDTLLNNPVIILETDNIEIKAVTVTSKQMNDYQRAKKNLSFLKEFKAPSNSKIKKENNPVKTIMTENNRIMRTEASSINLMQFSRAKADKMVKKHAYRKSRSTDYSSTRKQKEIEEEEETDENE